ncbi:MAG: transketolase, partial [Rhodospirillales bacterium]|nr:transketolase [Rhodospirillales bacterium]
AEAKKAAAASPADQPTRQASKRIMEALVPVIPSLVGGSADLTPSNLSRPDGFPEIAPGDFSGRYIHFGVREHAMAAITNGMALHKGLLPYCATFLCFLDYCRPAVRLSALMEQKVIYLFTHDTITQGPDGPTHQPVEHFVTLRATPNFLFLRPADAVEAAECWELALEAKDQPVTLVLTREAVPQVRFEHTDENLCRRGAYVFAEADGEAKVTILATGSEVCVARDAREILQSGGIPTRVVSMPCLEIFDQQPEDFRQAILGPGTLRVSVEAATAVGWERYVGQDGLIIGMTTFGASGLTDEINEHFGFTGEQVAEAIKARLNG